MRKHGLLLTHALVTSIKPQKPGLQHPSVRGYRLLIFGRARSFWVTFGHIWSSVATKTRSPSGGSHNITMKLGHLWPLLDALGHFWTVLVTVGHLWASPRNRLSAVFGIPLMSATANISCKGLSTNVRQAPPNSLKLHPFCGNLPSKFQLRRAIKSTHVHQGSPKSLKLHQDAPRPISQKSASGNSLAMAQTFRQNQVG